MKKIAKILEQDEVVQVKLSINFKNDYIPRDKENSPPLELPKKEEVFVKKIKAKTVGVKNSKKEESTVSIRFPIK